MRGRVPLKIKYFVALQKMWYLLSCLNNFKTRPKWDFFMSGVWCLVLLNYTRFLSVKKYHRKRNRTLTFHLSNIIKFDAPRKTSYPSPLLNTKFSGTSTSSQSSETFVWNTGSSRNKLQKSQSAFIIKPLYCSPEPLNYRVQIMIAWNLIQIV